MLILLLLYESMMCLLFSIMFIHTMEEGNRSFLHVHIPTTSLWKVPTFTGLYHHDQSRISTGHGIGFLVQDEHSDWKNTGSFMQHQQYYFRHSVNLKLAL